MMQPVQHCSVNRWCCLEWDPGALPLPLFLPSVQNRLTLAPQNPFTLLLMSHSSKGQMECPGKDVIIISSFQPTAVAFTLTSSPQKGVPAAPEIRSLPTWQGANDGHPTMGSSLSPHL